jgi:hypothetical protein
MSIEIPKNLTELRAVNMAKVSGIELTPKQLTQYVQYRHGNFSNHPRTRDLSVPIFHLSDQRLLDVILTNKQRVVLSSYYPNIFDFDSNKQKLYPTFVRKIRV